MEHEQEKQTPGVFRVYRKLRYVLFALVLLIMAASAAQVVYVFGQYWKGEDVYRAANDAYILPPRTPQPGSRQTVPPASVDPGQSAEATPDPDGNIPEGPDATPVPGAPDDATPAPNAPDEPQEFAPFSVDFDGLRAVNAECVGWISIPDTKISFPVMRAENNSKYLTILPDGTKNSNGSIFMDCRCNPDMSDRNTIIYGHHMENGAMFASLDKFFGRSFFNEHRTAYYLTPDADYKITIIACARVAADGEAYDWFETDEELRTYLAGALKNASVSAPVDVNGIDRILTLSTCSGRTGVRTIVIGTIKRIGY
ncbi:MAG: class B sortase [Clostridia bacterium]|nr:class B sortase [Clostridia bacterium]